MTFAKLWNAACADVLASSTPWPDRSHRSGELRDPLRLAPAGGRGVPQSASALRTDLRLRPRGCRAVLVRGRRKQAKSTGTALLSFVTGQLLPLSGPRPLLPTRRQRLRFRLLELAYQNEPAPSDRHQTRWDTMRPSRVAGHRGWLRSRSGDRENEQPPRSLPGMPLPRPR